MRTDRIITDTPTRGHTIQETRRPESNNITLHTPTSFGLLPSIRDMTVALSAGQSTDTSSADSLQGNCRPITTTPVFHAVPTTTHGSSSSSLVPGNSVVSPDNMRTNQSIASTSGNSLQETRHSAIQSTRATSSMEGNCRPISSITALKGGNFEVVSDRQKRERRSQIKRATDQFLHTLVDQIGLKPHSMKLETSRGNILDWNFQSSSRKRPSNPDRPQEVTKSLLYILLKFGISQECYHELTQEFPCLPRTYKVKEAISALETPEVFKVSGSFPGAYFKFKDILLKRLEEVITEYPSMKRARVRISGDGAKYSRSSNFNIMSFNILTGHNDLSCKAVHTIAAVKLKEDYDGLAEGYADCFETINEAIANPHVTINGINYNLEFFLCCDYKFTLLILGLQAAHSNHACAWCTIHRLQRYNMKVPDEKYLIHMKRTFSSSGPGYVRPNIDPDHVILDELHLLLRITYRLIENLISGAKASDRCTEALSGPMMKRLIDTIKSCGVTFYVKSVTKDNIEFTSLTGTDRKKLLQFLPSKMHQCQPALYYKEVKVLWEKFSKLYTAVSSTHPPAAAMISTMAKDWINNHFLTLGKHCDGYAKDRVTPYMHALSYHVGHFIQKYGNIKQFSCQAVEKNNDTCKHIYFRHSNRWNAASDIIKHSYKLDSLRFYEREKHSYSKNDDEYWEEGGIQEDRLKRQRLDDE